MFFTANHSFPRALWKEMLLGLSWVGADPPVLIFSVA